MTSQEIVEILDERADLHKKLLWDYKSGSASSEFHRGAEIALRSVRDMITRKEAKE